MRAPPELRRRTGAISASLAAVTAAAVLLTLGMAGLGAHADDAISTDTPEATVASLHRGLIAAAQSSPASVDARYRALEPLIEKTHDLRYIAEFALRKQWPDEGTWMLVINTGGRAQGVTALVDVSAQGEVAGVRVPTRRSDGWDRMLSR